jgi:hypothetical protein
MSSNNKPTNMPQKIFLLVGIMSLISILAAKEWFTLHVDGLARDLNLTVSDTWLVIFVSMIFGVVLLTWFFTSIKISRK